MPIMRWKGTILRRYGKIARSKKCCCEEDLVCDCDCPLPEELTIVVGGKTCIMSRRVEKGSPACGWIYSKPGFLDGEYCVGTGVTVAEVELYCVPGSTDEPEWMLYVWGYCQDDGPPWDMFVDGETAIEGVCPPPGDHNVTIGEIDPEDGITFIPCATIAVTVPEPAP